MANWLAVFVIQRCLPPKCRMVRPGPAVRGHMVPPHASQRGMRFELWEGSDPELGGLESTVLGPGPEYERSRQMLEPWMHMTATFEADSHDAAMQLMYDRKGWGHYLTWGESQETSTSAEIQGVIPDPDSE